MADQASPVGWEEQGADRAYELSGQPAGSSAAGVVEDERDPAQSEGIGGEVERSSRTPIRRYEGDRVAVEMMNVSAVRQAVADPNAYATYPVLVELADGAEVRSTVTFHRPFGHRIIGSHSEQICSSCGSGLCAHSAVRSEAVGALVNGRRIRTSLQSWEQSVAAASAEVQTDHDLARQATRQRAELARPDGPNWADEPSAFQQAYDSARTAQSIGEPPVPFYTENATAGLGARDGGRPFGVEVEFVVPDRHRNRALAAIGRDLHEAGITQSAHQQRYHSGGSDYSQWRFEHDATVDGEIVSPILYDEPESWRQIEQVCEIVRRHGGSVDRRAGAHVHVGVADYDHDVSCHNHLLAMVAQNEDVIYRIAQNPQANRHRGTRWCIPNQEHQPGYRTIREATRSNEGHHLAVNLAGVRGTTQDHVEFRMFDGSLDPGTIQAQVNVSLALADSAARTPRRLGDDREAIGTHQRANSYLRRGQRLAGDEWTQDTSSFRSMMDRLFTTTRNRVQVASLFAVNRWQRSI